MQSLNVHAAGLARVILRSRKLLYANALLAPCAGCAQRHEAIQRLIERARTAAVAAAVIGEQKNAGKPR